VELSNQDYIRVNILRCGDNLVNLRILGTVYSLKFTLSKKWTKETVPQRKLKEGEEEVKVLEMEINQIS
jgi:hypothetical protein